jgi:hypothetical protein
MGLFKTRINPIDGITPFYDGTEIKTTTLGVGGSGYAINDLFSITGGVENAVGKVLTVSSGAVLTFSILRTGTGYAPANALATTPVTGTGVGLTVNVTTLQTANTIFVCPIVGNDNNVGTRNEPFATMTKGNTIATLPYCVYRGMMIENPPLIGTRTHIFEGEDAVLNGNISTDDGAPVFYNLKCNSLTSSYPPSLYSSNVTNLTTFEGLYTLRDSFITNLNSQIGGSTYQGNNTILNFNNYYSSNNSLYCNITSSIFVNSVDLYPYKGLANTIYPIFRYCLFRKATLWQWNGVTIPITYVSGPNNYLTDVINGLTAYAATLTGTAQTYLNLIIANSFYTDPILGQSNYVMDDTVLPLFNRYNTDGSILDYTLSSNSNNRALTMGDPSLQYQYVGCYKPNIGGVADSIPMTWGTILHVNTDGSDDDVTPPDILEFDSLGRLSANQASTQFRNRVRTNVLAFVRGKSLFGVQSSLASGIGSGFFFGKMQSYSATQLPQESVEVIPYDTLTTPSVSLPRFSVALNGQAQMWYWLPGTTKAGLPVLFNDLASLGITNLNKSLTEYGTWAVTNVDYESLALSQLTTYVTLEQINIIYLQAEININYV